MTTTATRGYALVLVMLILGVLGIALITMFDTLGASAKNTGATVEQRRLFYACEATMRAVSKVVSEYSEERVPTAGGMLDAVCQVGGGGCTIADGAATLSDDPIPALRPDGFIVTDLAIVPMSAPCDTDSECGVDRICFKEQPSDKGVCRVVSMLPSGSFTGMRARQDNVIITVGAKRQGESEHRCRLKQTLALAKISMFQFFMFSNLPMTDWAPGALAAARGRIHANGDLCIGGNGPLFVDRVTAAGSIYPPTAQYRDQCGAIAPAGAPQIPTVPAPVFDRFPHDMNPVDPMPGHFMPMSRTNDAQWKTIAAQSHNHVLDKAHGVMALRLPVQRGENPPFVPAGYDASGATVSNEKSLRFLLDPVRSSSPEEIERQKLAFKSSLRIIDGVWYAKSSESASGWPGVPLWSDHLGRYATQRAGLQEAVVPDGIPVGQDDLFNGVARPRRYSPYVLNHNTGMLETPSNALNQQPVISYGALFRTGNGRYSLGYRNHTTVSPASTPHNVLSGTRTGFTDVHSHTSAQGNAAKQRLAHVLPINFNVEAFQNALASREPHELGTRLQELGVEWNGIVYISSTWDGSQRGDPQEQGNFTDPQQPIVTAGVQSALPHALCGDRVGPLTPGGQPFRAFTCERGSRPNAVRITHARAIDKPDGMSPSLAANQLPKGLTIVTPLPLYVLGDVNVTSNAAELNKSLPTYFWRPVLLAGDVISLQSHMWSDEPNVWGSPPNPQQSSDMTINAAFLGGVVPTTSTTKGGGVENFFRRHERWSGRTLRMRGAIVISHTPIYARWPVDVSMNAPIRDWAYDEHLEDLSIQPPGTPYYDVTATRLWQRY